MTEKHRSACPIAASLDVLGDRWTLVVLRDVLLAERSSFLEIGEQEGIATNVLTNRLERLIHAGVIQRRSHPTDKRRRIYLPTERGIALIPVMAELIVWGDAHTSARGQVALAQAIRTDRVAVIAELTARARKRLIDIEA